MALHLTIKNDGLRLAAKRLEGVNPSNTVQRNIMRNIASYMKNETIKRFERQEGPDGQKWQDLAPATINKRAGKAGANRRAVIMGSAKKLRHHGLLFRSLSRRANSTRAEIGTNVIYASIHQFGGQAGRGKKTAIPARPFLGINGDNETRIKHIVEQYLKGAV